MSESKVLDATKPQMRGLHNAAMKRHLTIAFGLVTLTALSWKYLVAEPRKKKYAEFYRTYDPIKSFEKMKAAGLFQSCKNE